MLNCDAHERDTYHGEYIFDLVASRQQCCLIFAVANDVQLVPVRDLTEPIPNCVIQYKYDYHYPWVRNESQDEEQYSI